MRSIKLGWLALIAMIALGPAAVRADTVASLLGNFTINQFCGLDLSGESLEVHYAVVFAQLPALRELHDADSDHDGVTSQAERDAYAGRLASRFADGLEVRLDGLRVPLRAMHWTSSLPTEQGGFSLRMDVDFSAALPRTAPGAERLLQFANRNYPGRLGWHEIVVQPTHGVFVYDTDAYSSSLTGGLTEALAALPPAGPLDEREVHLKFGVGTLRAGAVPLAARPGSTAPGPDGTTASRSRSAASNRAPDGVPGGTWLARETRHLVESISAPRLEPGIAALALLGALLLGAVHALSPGHGKTIVGAYLIGSHGTPRHAAFLGLTVTVTHTAGVFILGFATLYASRFIMPERLFPALNLLSALLVLGMGMVLLVQRGRAARRALLRAAAQAAPVFHAVRGSALESHATKGLVFAKGYGTHLTHSHDGLALHSHGGEAPHSHLPPGAAGETVTWQSLLALGVSGGLVPCPSAMVLLLAAVALNKTALGLSLVLAFSIGLAVTLTAVGLAFLYARNRIQKPPASARWPHLLPILSAGIITVVGIALCRGALMSFGS